MTEVGRSSHEKFGRSKSCNRARLETVIIDRDNSHFAPRISFHESMWALVENP